MWYGKSLHVSYVGTSPLTLPIQSCSLCPGQIEADHEEGTPQEILRFAFFEVYKCTSVCISIVVETPECLTYPASGFMLYTPTVIVPKNLSTSMSLLSSSIYSLFTRYWGVIVHIVSFAGHYQWNIILRLDSMKTGGLMMGPSALYGLRVERSKVQVPLSTKI